MNKLKINTGWIFTKENNPTYQSEPIENGEKVTLPHTFNADDGQNGGDFYRGSTWYQKSIEVTEDDLNGEVYLEVNGASLQSQVYVNGTLVTVNKTGFSMYRVPVTPCLKTGRNLIAIQVSNEKDGAVYPLGADFTFYGGIYRDVYLLKTQKLHLDLFEHGRAGFFVESTEAEHSTFLLSIKGTVINESSQTASTAITCTLLNAEGDTIFSRSQAIIVEREGTSFFTFEQQVDNPMLWEGVENPYLYTVEVVVSDEHGILDRRQAKTGFRTIEVTPDKGVFLNGKSIKLNGVSRHQDFAEVGNALTREMMDMDMDLIKKIGANTVRLSHYQHDDYFYQLCDEAGILVWTEIPFISVPTTVDPDNQNAKDQLQALIQQTRNHTSVFTYGIQNEITIAAENERTYRLVSELNQLAQQLDPSRYTAQANIYSVADESYLNGLTNIIGYNLYYGWYYGEMEDMGTRLDEFHEANPTVPVMVTEYGTDANPFLHSYEPQRKDYTEEYQMLYHENALKTFNSRPFVLGGTVWNMFDFGSANRDEGGNKGKNQKGLVTIDRKVKKDAFYLYKAYWSKEPFIRIAGTRFVKRHHKYNQLAVLSNIEAFDVVVNGELRKGIPSQGPKTLVDVQLQEGKNEVRVLDAATHQIVDQAFFELVEQEEKSYVYVPKDNRRHVTNWFEEFDLTNVQEVELRKDGYSTYDSIGNLLRNPEAKVVVEKYFGKMFESGRHADMKEVATIEGLSKLSSMGIPKELLVVVNQELNQIEKDMSYVRLD